MFILPRFEVHDIFKTNNGKHDLFWTHHLMDFFCSLILKVVLHSKSVGKYQTSSLNPHHDPPPLFYDFLVGIII